MNAVLGFDTATAELTVAATRGGEVLAEVDVGPEASGRPRHGTRLLPAVEEVAGQVGGWGSIGLLAVGVGPGTFTGLRIGIATARALAQARSLPVAGVSSLAALAAGVRERQPGEPCLAVLDARRRECFAALYDAEGEARWPAWVGSPAELAQRVADDAASPLAVGEGSVRFREQLEGAGAVVPPDADALHRVRARHLCRLAELGPAGRFDEIEPTYLRRPDAELWRERDHRPDS